MAVTLTYEPLLDRVKVGAAGLGSGTAAKVERSADQVRWSTVRGAAAAPVVIGTIAVPVYDYEFKPGVVNYYRVTVQPAGLHVAASSTANASTPDAAALDITGDISITVDVSMDDWSPSPAIIVAGKWTSPNDLSYALILDTAGKPQMWWSTSGAAGTAAGVLATVGLPLSSGQRAKVRASLDVNNGAGGKTITFDYSTDGGATFIPLGTPVPSVGTTSVFSGAGVLTVGSTSTASWTGVVHSLEVRNSAGTVVANPQFDVQDNADTSFVDAVGRTWTVNGAAAILTSQTSSITPAPWTGCGTANVWLKNISRPFLNRAVEVINPGAITITRQARVGLFDIVGRSYPVAVTDVRKSRRWTMTVRTNTAADAVAMDLLLASGDVLLVQTPPGSSTPGGYVAVGDADRAAHPLRPNRVTWTLPCTEVAPPGPDVVGSAVTWQTVLDAYPTWFDLITNVPTWADLLTLIGSPTEVIVP